MFVENPILPLAVLLHDTKRQLSHDRFVQILQQEIPSMPKHCVLVTDGEDALKNAFRSHYPKLDQLRCWNHLNQNIKAAAKSHYVPAQQITNVDENDPSVVSKKKREILNKITDTISNLLRASSKLDFTKQYNNISQTWPPKFRNWFNQNLLSTIDEIGQ